MLVHDLYKQLEKNCIELGLQHTHKIAIAVSGGADSIALLHLLTLYKKKTNIEFVVLTVNHNLRAEAKQDSLFVENTCTNLGLKCYSLEWKHNNSKKSQEDARNARYELLTKQCIELKISTLLTAHHMDDILETYLMRKEKKSGIFGLLPSKQNFLHNIQIIRPLYNISKQDLINYLSEIGQEYCIDPTNVSEKYERGRLRNTLQSASDYINLRQEKLKAQKALESDAQNIQKNIAKFLAEYIRFDKMGYAVIIDANQLFESQEAFYILAHLITTVRGINSTPRGSSITTLLNQLKFATNPSPKNRNIFSLHGTKIQYLNNTIIFTREFGKNAPEHINIHSKTVIWDNRFILKIHQKHIARGYSITHLMPNDIATLKKLQIDLPDNHILLTLPVIKKDKKLVAIPHLNYYDARNETTNYTVQFKSQFVSNIVHFYSY